MKITLYSNYNNYILAWYGDQSSKVEPFELSQISKYIDTVYKMRENGEPWQIHKPNYEENQFETLEMGNIYYFKFNKTNSDTNFTFEIPNLYSSSVIPADFTEGPVIGIDDIRDPVDGEPEEITTMNIDNESENGEYNGEDISLPPIFTPISEEREDASKTTPTSVQYMMDMTGAEENLETPTSAKYASEFDGVGDDGQFEPTSDDTGPAGGYNPPGVGWFEPTIQETPSSEFSGAEGDPTPTSESGPAGGYNPGIGWFEPTIQETPSSEFSGADGNPTPTSESGPTGGYNPDTDIILPPSFPETPTSEFSGADGDPTPTSSFHAIPMLPDETPTSEFSGAEGDPTPTSSFYGIPMLPDETPTSEFSGAEGGSDEFAGEPPLAGMLDESFILETPTSEFAGAEGDYDDDFSQNLDENNVNPAEVEPSFEDESTETEGDYGDDFSQNLDENNVNPAEVEPSFEDESTETEGDYDDDFSQNLDENDTNSEEGENSEYSNEDHAASLDDEVSEDDGVVDTIEDVLFDTDPAQELENGYIEEEGSVVETYEDVAQNESIEVNFENESDIEMIGEYDPASELDNTDEVSTEENVMDMIDSDNFADSDELQDISMIDDFGVITDEGEYETSTEILEDIPVQDIENINYEEDSFQENNEFEGMEEVVNPITNEESEFLDMESMGEFVEDEEILENDIDLVDLGDSNISDDGFFSVYEDEEFVDDYTDSNDDVDFVDDYTDSNDDVDFVDDYTDSNDDVDFVDDYTDSNDDVDFVDDYTDSNDDVINDSGDFVDDNFDEITYPTPTSDASFGEETDSELYCPEDVKECSDGSFVSRNPYNNCEFDDCPDEVVENEENFSEPPMPDEDDTIDDSVEVDYGQPPEEEFINTVGSDGLDYADVNSDDGSSPDYSDDGSSPDYSDDDFYLNPVGTPDSNDIPLPGFENEYTTPSSEDTDGFDAYLPDLTDPMYSDDNIDNVDDTPNSGFDGNPEYLNTPSSDMPSLYPESDLEEQAYSPTSDFIEGQLPDGYTPTSVDIADENLFDSTPPSDYVGDNENVATPTSSLDFPSYTPTPVNNSEQTDESTEATPSPNTYSDNTLSTPSSTSMGEFAEGEDDTPVSESTPTPEPTPTPYNFPMPEFIMK